MIAPTITKHPIPERLHKDINEALMVDLDRSLAGSADRNRYLRTWDSQLRGEPHWAGMKPRWRGGCDFEDPITREHHLQCVANGMQTYSTEDRYIVNPVNEDDIEDAASLEAWLNDLVNEHGLNGQVAYDILYNTARHSYSILYAGWKQAYRTHYETYYEDEDGNRVEPEDREPGSKYKQKEDIYEEVAHEGLDFRVPHPTDVYFFPANAASLEATDCRGVAERIYLSATDLLDGIDDYGYDADKVHQILATRAVGGNGETYRRERDSADGLNPEEDGLYECFMVIGRPPLLMDDGHSRLGNEERRRDYLWMVCLERRIVFKFVPSPFQRRPYVLFQWLREPGRMIGDGVCSLLGVLQREATIAARFRVDVRDLTMSPTLLVPETAYDDLQRFKTGPGAMLPYGPQWGPQSIVPLQWDKSGFGAALQDGNDFRMRAAQMFSTTSRGLVPTEGRTATEIRGAAAGADEKFDLFLSCLNTGWKDVAEHILSLYQQFGGNDPIERLIGNKAVTVAPEALHKSFRINVAASSENSNPDIRMQKAQMLAGFAKDSPSVQMAVQKGDMRSVYAVEMEFLRALKIKNPQSIIGQEPQAPPDPQFILQQVASAAKSAAQLGDPFAGRLLQMLMQMQASTPGQGPGGGAQGGQAGSQGPKMSLSLNFKDAPPALQAQIEQAYGFQPVAPLQNMRPMPAGGPPQMNGVGH